MSSLPLCSFASFAAGLFFFDMAGRRGRGGRPVSEASANFLDECQEKMARFGQRSEDFAARHAMRYLVAIDGGPVSEAAFKTVCTAMRKEDDLIIVHIVRPSFSLPFSCALCASSLPMLAAYPRPRFRVYEFDTPFRCRTWRRSTP